MKEFLPISKSDNIFVKLEIQLKHQIKEQYAPCHKTSCVLHVYTLARLVFQDIVQVKMAKIKSPDLWLNFYCDIFTNVLRDISYVTAQAESPR